MPEIADEVASPATLTDGELFGRRLKIFRVLCGLNQFDLAHAIGGKPQEVSRIECGLAKHISFSLLKRLMRFVKRRGIDPDLFWADAAFVTNSAFRTPQSAMDGPAPPPTDPRLPPGASDSLRQSVTPPLGTEGSKFQVPGSNAQSAIRNPQSAMEGSPG